MIRRGCGGAGVVALWDVGTGQQLAEYEAHQKRIWAVDFCHSEPMHFVSGSDDGWVRVWSTSEQDALAQIDMKANVCCVKYNAAVPHQVRPPATVPGVLSCVSRLEEKAATCAWCLHLMCSDASDFTSL